jgi:hypothetical protein
MMFCGLAIYTLMLVLVLPGGKTIWMVWGSITMIW